MLSRRQFFSITVIMLVLLVMFQFTGVMKDYWNEYDKNKYAEAVNSELKAEDAYEIARSEEDVSDTFVILIGDPEASNIGKMAQLWCEYTKRDLLTYEALDAVSEKLSLKAEVILLDSEYLDFDKDTKTLSELADTGASMIFCNLPEMGEIKANYLLRELLGIYAIYDTVTAEGIDLYEGFLLGGRTIYEATNEKEEELQDLELDIPWYATYAHTKRYMIGLVAEDALGSGYKVKNEDMPSIIWRNNVGKARIFAVNGDYMEDITALGILDAMMYEMEDYVIYPVVNAQNFVVTDFAGLSSELDDEMEKNYTRSQKAVFQDLIWPSLSSIYANSSDKPTFFINPQLDYTDEEEADGKQLVYYMKLISEAGAEAGITYNQISSVSANTKLKKDKAFYDEYLSEYKFGALYAGNENEDYYESDAVTKNLTDLRTVCLSNDLTDAPVSYAECGATKQRTTVDGFEHTYSDNLRVKSLQTALAYSNILVDMGTILYSDEKQDSWEISSERLASNVITYWKPFSVFDKTVLTESDTRVRQFLNLSYDDVRDGNIITVKTENLKENAYFILRTHNESIEAVKGGNFQEIEEHAYLICAEKESVEITLCDDASIFYYKDK